MSNGETAAGDGHTITLNGQTYASGLGVHAASQLVYALNGAYSTFTSDVGVDDEVGKAGSVTFEVWVDGVRKYASPVLTGVSAAVPVSVDVSGATTLKLVVTNGGDNIDSDHADWAGAALSSAAATPTASATASPAPTATSTAAPPVTSAPAPQTCTGPLTITQGGTYTGCWVSNSQGVAVTIATSSPVTIANSTIKGTGRLIVSSVSNVRLTVTGSHLSGLYPGGSGKWADWAIWLDNFASFDFQHNALEQKGGIFLNGWSGAATTHPVLVRYNAVKNLDGRLTDGSGGYSGSTITSFLQFSGVQNAPGIDVSWNEIHNAPNLSAVEDNINLWKSSGTSSSPIDIHDNYVDGGYPFPAAASSYYGGGIMLGDGGGDYQSAHDNQVVATTNYGLAISGGTNMQVYNNRAVSAGVLPDGTKLPSVNNGLYVWNQYSAAFGNDSAYNNTVGWWDSVHATRVDWWLPNCSGNCANNALGGNSSQVTTANETNEQSLWQSKVAGAGITVGP